MRSGARLERERIRLRRGVTSGRWKFGLALAIITTLSWSTLPIALEAALVQVDPWTLTWFRFLVAASVMGPWLARRTTMGGLEARTSRSWALLGVAALALTSNYMFYLTGLDRTSPAVAQVLIQLAPMMMALGGILIFGERYSRAQWSAFVVLIAGLVVFFRDQIGAVTEGSGGRLWQGALLIVLAAIAWASYALAQKQLLRSFTSTATMMSIYVFATIVLAPAASPSVLLTLSATTWLIVGYCAVNTLIAYGAFSEALNHWEASRVSAVLALTPLGTMGFSALLSSLFPASVPAESLDVWSLVGASMVVAGSMTTSLAGKRASS
jgi:drug/metabolite transporter (DMT)-like permease